MEMISTKIFSTSIHPVFCDPLVSQIRAHNLLQNCDTCKVYYKDTFTFIRVEYIYIPYRQRLLLERYYVTFRVRLSTCQDCDVGPGGVEVAWDGDAFVDSPYQSASPNTSSCHETRHTNTNPQIHFPTATEQNRNGRERNRIGTTRKGAAMGRNLEHIASHSFIFFSLKQLLVHEETEHNQQMKKTTTKAGEMNTDTDQ